MLREEEIEAQSKQREIDQIFHLWGLRNKTSLFALQSVPVIARKLADSVFEDTVSLLTQLSVVLRLEESQLTQLADVLRQENS